MKAILLSILLSVSSLFGGELTNGVFYVDKSVECHLIAQNGATVTNQIPSGDTRMVGTTLVELCPTNQTTIYFSGGLIVTADANSVLSINTFDQEVNNLTETPRPATFGAHNISITLSKGNFVVLYPVQDASSTFAISTPLALYQMNVGKFQFQVSDQKSLVYVLDGMMTVHGDKNRVDTAKKGNKSITGQIDTEVATTTRPINSTESSTVSIAQTTADASSGIVKFFVIDGRVRGALLK